MCASLFVNWNKKKKYELTKPRFKIVTRLSGSSWCISVRIVAAAGKLFLSKYNPESFFSTNLQSSQKLHTSQTVLRVKSFVCCTASGKFPEQILRTRAHIHAGNNFWKKLANWLWWICKFSEWMPCMNPSVVNRVATRYPVLPRYPVLASLSPWPF